MSACCKDLSFALQQFWTSSPASISYEEGQWRGALILIIYDRICLYCQYKKVLQKIFNSLEVLPTSWCTTNLPSPSSKSIYPSPTWKIFPSVWKSTIKLTRSLIYDSCSITDQKMIIYSIKMYKLLQTYNKNNTHCWLGFC